MFGVIQFKSKINQFGAGIGLYVTKLMSSLINAEISFKTLKGRGTTFSLIIKKDFEPASSQTLNESSRMLD